MDNFHINNVEIIVATKSNMLEVCELNRKEYWEDISKVTDEELFELGKWWVYPDLLFWHYEILLNCKGKMLLAFYNNKIIGQLDYIVSNDFDNGKYITRLHVIWLLVKKEFRRKGISRKLIDHIKKIHSDQEIWVEPEDDRSKHLYAHIGKQIKAIDNWKMEITNLNFDLDNLKLPTRDNINYNEFKKLISNNKIRCIIGKYYAPEFDIEQLLQSDDVHEYIWGNTEKAQILVFNSIEHTVYAIITQYPRIYVNSLIINTQSFEKIMYEVVQRIKLLGFDEIFVQVYREDNLDEMLIQIGFKLEEGNYPVYKI